jgi:2-hydroxychromene-2-carboxylate isomerase
VYRANFAEDREISDAAVLSEILSDLGQDAHALLEQAGTPETKQRLREQSDEAVSLGIFGAPTLVAEDEMFWGNDRLEQALEWASAIGSVKNS